MKIFILLVFCCICLFISAQQSASPKLTTTEIYNDVKEGFTKLINSLEGPAKYTYERYVLQYRLSGIIQASIYFLVLITLSIVSAKAFKYGKWEDDRPNNKWGTAQIWSTILLCVTVLTILIDMSNQATQIFNPEYHAIQAIIESFKK